jgi:anti-sigma-K factor RskA
MIPDDQEELEILAGEYVLGVLDAGQVAEVVNAIATNTRLRAAVTFWQDKLDPLTEIVVPASPPTNAWDAISRRIKPARSSHMWNGIRFWRWSSAGLAAVAAALILYIALAPISPAPNLVSVLHPLQQDQASWIATIGRDGLHLSALASASPPNDRAYELWAIAAGATRPSPLGVIPADGRFALATIPTAMTDGATLAISVEPPGGSPTGQPTGPVIFVGTLRKL